MTDYLTGAFLDIVVVDGGEERVVDGTTDDIHLYLDAARLSFDMILQESCDNFRACGLIDEDGALAPSEADEFRVDIYHSPHDDYVAKQYVMDGVSMNLRDGTLPIDDVATVTVDVNGENARLVDPEVPLYARLKRRAKEVVPFL